jgi:hypothetical protein
VALNEIKEAEKKTDELPQYHPFHIHCNAKVERVMGELLSSSR